MLVDEFDPLKGEMLQVLDKEGNVVAKSLEPKLPVEMLRRMYYFMVLSRVGDERMLKLQRSGRIGTFPPAVGQEAASVGSAIALEKEDWSVHAFREQGAYYLRGVPPEKLFLYFGGDPRGNVIPDGINVTPMAVPVGSQVPHAVGIALASKMRKDGRVTMVYFGDGATSEGDFHEGMNFAGVNRCPVVFVCQNNQWAISVPRERQTASRTIAQKAVAYGFRGILVDGNDVLAMYLACKEAVERARNGGGPTLIEAYTYRLWMHTTADDPSKYRSKEEENQWADKDPLKRFRNYLASKKVWNEEFEKQVQANALAEIERAVKAMEGIGPLKPDDLFDHMFAEITKPLSEQKEYLKKALAEREVEEEKQEIRGGFP